MLFRHYGAWMSAHLHRCRTMQGSLADRILLLSQCSQPCTNRLPSVYEQNVHLTPFAIWKLPTNHHWVVAWLLLDANCPVLLTRGGIPRNGLTAQWLQQFASSTEVTTLFVIEHVVCLRQRSVQFVLLSVCYTLCTHICYSRLGEWLLCA